MPTTAVVGLTGGIAVYRLPDLVRKLRQREWQVHVLMTRAACRFITPLTMQTVSDNPVVVDMFAQPRVWNVQHIAYARQADVVLVAPATATTLARLATGWADDMVSATVLATRAPVLVAPAMNTTMWENPAVQHNVQVLQSRGMQLITPEAGELACGEAGEGRLPALEHLEAALVKRVEGSPQWKGKTVLVTAGPTREPLDPVRFLSNPSTGKMGVAIARTLLERGARVILVHGPLQVPVPAQAEGMAVETAQEMYQAVLEIFPESDVVIKAAAVSDYRPVQRHQHKVKKDGATLELQLEPNPDILATLGGRKGSRILVGFAAETEDGVEQAQRKLHKKNLNLLVVNDVSRADTGFASDTNAAWILRSDGSCREVPLTSKEELAEVLVQEVEQLLPRPQDLQ